MSNAPWRFQKSYTFPSTYPTSYERTRLIDPNEGQKLNLRLPEYEINNMFTDEASRRILRAQLLDAVEKQDLQATLRATTNFINDYIARDRRKYIFRATAVMYGGSEDPNTWCPDLRQKCHDSIQTMHLCLMRRPWLPTADLPEHRIQETIDKYMEAFEKMACCCDVQGQNLAAQVMNVGGWASELFLEAETGMKWEPMDSEETVSEVESGTDSSHDDQELEVYARHCFSGPGEDPSYKFPFA